MTGLEHEKMINDLRFWSEKLNEEPKEQTHFPELSLGIGNQTGKTQEDAVYRAASTITKHDDIDAGHKVNNADLAALIHYIADMME